MRQNALAICSLLTSLAAMAISLSVPRDGVDRKDVEEIKATIDRREKAHMSRVEGHDSGIMRLMRDVRLLKEHTRMPSQN